MWAEENYNNYDLLSIVKNYGPNMAFGISAKEAIVFAKDFHAEFYLREDELNKLANQGYDFYINQDGLNRLLRRINSEIPLVQSAIKRLVSLDLAKISNQELFKEYEKYCRPYGNLMRSYIVTQPHFLAKVEKELMAYLSKFSNQNELFSILTSPNANFVFSEKGKFFKKSFAEMLAAENAKINKGIAGVALCKEKKADKNRKRKIANKYSLSKDLLKLADIISNVAEARLKMRFVWMPWIYFFELFLIELKRRYKISKSVIRRYDMEEFEELLTKGALVDDKTILERSKGFVKVLKNKRIETLTGKKAAEFIKKINNQKINVKEIRGVIASRGLVRGRVIILSYTKSLEHTSKIKKMSKGDILVSEMTRPNIIIACKKAGAIITDEGGITCHAAIVSRELKKPCIIGTKIATKVLQDGDLVEVDANKGVIKILKNK